MKWLVTGATGFIGSRLCLHGREQGWDMHGLGKLNNPAEEQNAQELVDAGVALHDVSILEPAPLADVMRGVDVVVHLAAAQHEANVPDEYFRSINVDGTRNVLEAAAAASVSRVVHGSTIGVYGWKPDTPVSEDSPLEPGNIYGVTKLAAEESCAPSRACPGRSRASPRPTARAIAACSSSSRVPSAA